MKKPRSTPRHARTLTALSSIENEIGKEIVTSFHEQFAENQNHHQKLFLQVLAVLLSVLVGFGFIYVRVDSGGTGQPSTGDKLNISLDTLFYFLVLAMCLLSMAVALICSMGYGFRRDQLTAANIRVKTNVMTIGSNDNFFFESFNPQPHIGLIEWMPSFHLIFFVALILIKWLLLLGTLFYPERWDIHGDIVPSEAVCAVIAMLTFTVDLLSWIVFLRKWRKCAREAPDRLWPKDDAKCKLRV